MSDMGEFIDRNINLTIPVIVGYKALDEYLREKLIGELVSNEKKDGKKSTYARIIDISIEKSDLEGFDILLNIGLQTLTNLFKNRQVKIFFHAALKLDRELQHLSLTDFEVDGKTKNWFADKLLETIVNKWIYEKIKRKMNFDLMPLIEEKIGAINVELENKLEMKEGMNLIGSLNKVEISNLRAGEKELWISVSICGTGLLELEKLKF